MNGLLRQKCLISGAVHKGQSGGTFATVISEKSIFILDTISLRFTVKEGHSKIPPP